MAKVSLVMDVLINVDRTKGYVLQDGLADGWTQDELLHACLRQDLGDTEFNCIPIGSGLLLDMYRMNWVTRAALRERLRLVVVLENGVRYPLNEFGNHAVLSELFLEHSSAAERIITTQSKMRQVAKDKK